MKNKISQLLQLGITLLFSVFFSTYTFATPTSFIEQGDEWNYTTLSFDLWNIWSSVDYNTFDFSSATYNTGEAAFGNASTYTTYWQANTDLALMQSFVFNGSLNGDLTLNVASDNGFVIFLNGQQIAKENAEGFTHYWEYTFTIDANSLLMGTNVVEVLAEDHGGLTFFDMELIGSVNVPEPGVLIMFALALIGIGRRGLKRFN